MLKKVDHEAIKKEKEANQKPSLGAFGRVDILLLFCLLFLCNVHMLLVQEETLWPTSWLEEKQSTFRQVRTIAMTQIGRKDAKLNRYLLCCSAVRQTVEHINRF